MILSNHTRRTFFVLSSIFFAISFSGCSGSGGGGGSGLVDGGAGGLANLGANDVAAWDIWFETNGQRNSQPVVNEPGNLVLTVINSFPRLVTLHIKWFEDGRLRFEDNYPNIPIGESIVSPPSYAFTAEEDHTIMAIITLVDPAVAEEPSNNQVSAPINVQAVGANPPPAGGPPAQRVDLTWTQVMMTDVAGINEIREPVAGVPVNIIATSINNGDTAAQNITRSFSMDGLSRSDNVAQCAPGQCAPYSILNYTFQRAGPNTFTLAMTGFTPGQAANARGATSLPVTVNVLAGANPAPSGGGQPVQGVDLTWSEVVMTDEAGINEVREPVAQVPVKIVAASTNYGDTAAQNISRFLNIDGAGDFYDSGVQINPGQTVPFVPPHTTTFSTAGDHTLSLSMTSFTPGQAANARGVLSTTIHVNVLPVGANPAPAGGVAGDLTVFLRELSPESLFYTVDGNDAIPDPSAIPAGMDGKINVAVWNHGNHDENNVQLRVEVDGRSIDGGNPTLERIPANDLRQVQIPYRFFGPGSYRITVDIDPNHRIREINESDNRIEKIVNVADRVMRDLSNPDIRCQNILFRQYATNADPGQERQSGENVTQATVGKKGSLIGNFYNTAGTRAENISASVMVDNRPVGDPVHVTILPGEIAQVEKANYSFATPGTHKMSLALQVPRGVPNSDTRYDIIERNIEVLSSGLAAFRPIDLPRLASPLTAVPPTLAMTSTAGPECELVAENVEFWVHGQSSPVTRVMVGQRGWVRYTIKNKKGKAVNNVHSEVRFLLNGQVTQIIPADLDIPSQGQKSGKNDVAPFTTPGMYKMALMVDPLNAKKDNHRGDNVLTRSLQVDAYRQYNPSNDSKPSGTTFVDTFPRLLDTFTGGKGPKKPSGYVPPPSTPTPPTPPPTKPLAKSPRKFTTAFQS